MPDKIPFCSICWMPCSEIAKLTCPECGERCDGCSTDRYCTARIYISPEEADGNE